MSVNLNHLTVFHSVAIMGSVTRGAERLLISQPAASRQIKELESALRTQLIERRSRGICLTAAGKVLADYAAKAFRLIDEAEGAMTELTSLRRGRLTIGASPTVGTYLMPRALVHFRRRFPGIDMRLEIGGSAALRNRLRDGEVDAIVTTAAIESDEFISRVVGEDTLTAIASPGHAITRRRSVTPAQFCAQPFISRDLGLGKASFVERTLAAHGLIVRPALILPGTEAVKQAVSAGLGVGIVPTMAIRNELLSGQLAKVRLAGISLTRPVHWLRLRRTEETKAARAFECVVKHAVRGTLPTIYPS